MNTIKVVNFDWLEDSLRSKKCLKERKYLMEVLHAKKRRQPKGELSCNSKVTKRGKPSKGELASLFISHLSEYQSSRSVGRGGLRQKPMMTTTCSNTAVDLLEAYLRARKEKLSAPKQQDEAVASATASPAYIPETNAELVDYQTMLMDPPDQPVSDLPVPSDSSTAAEPTNHKAFQFHRSVAPSKTNTLPSLRKPPQGNPSLDCLLPVDPLKYHIYKDDNGFEYSVTLVRIDIRRNSNERFVLRLYESHTSDLSLPAGDEGGIAAGAEAGTEEEGGHGTNTYTVWLRFVSEKNGGEPVIQCLAAEGSQFENAMGVFKSAFWTWTGRRWEERDKNLKDGGSGEGEDSGLDAQMEEHSVNWEDGMAMTVGLPSRDGVKSKPFVHVKPGAYARSKRAFGLGGILVAAKHATRE